MAPCSTPDSRVSPLFSSKPFSSISAVNSVKHLPSLSFTWPRPRPTEVSKVNQPSAPSALNAPGRTSESVAFSMSAIAERLSNVTMFQVKAIRSRQ